MTGFIGHGVPRVKAVKCFDIRLDNPFVVFQGDPNEAEPVELSGTLHLTNPESINIRSIKIKLEGKWKVSWFVEPTVSSLQVRDKGIIMDEELTLYPTDGASTHTSHKIAPGTHEWRFSFKMDPSIPESVEGLPGSFVVYDLKAEIDRGWGSKNLLAEKHVRVIRTLGRDMSETVPLPYSNEDTWKDKLWYHIYIPTRYYIFGTSITAEFILCPLHKGIKIGKIKMEILERIQLTTEAGKNRQHSKDTLVASHEEDMPSNTLDPRVEEVTGMPDESYHFKVTLPLERSLNRARQSMDSEHIKIFHNLKIYVNLHNPDGHISQLLVRNLLHIFISPSLRVGDDQMIQANPSQLAEVSETNESGQIEVPPTYERHRLDQLYDDIDPRNFMSGHNTPFYAMSRSTSHENLNGLFNSATAANTAANQRGSIHDPRDLQSRLAQLQDRESHSNIDEDFAHPSPRVIIQTPPPQTSLPSRHSALSFRALLRQSSVRSGVRSPTDSGYFPALPAHPQVHPPLPEASSSTPTTPYDMEALVRIPSYNTAVRTPVVTPPATGDGLPTYDIAMSTPNSPEHSPRNSVVFQNSAQAQAHVRSGSGSDGSDTSSIRTLSLQREITLRPEGVH
ncbi:NADH-ubiquinone oxidoreductase 30kDa subunit [Venturia nashicola]|uniref:NADH-ubiquinone oxidoreductase 30kDa subunit n=1 Tax=Venturia nashicola TaxID=86259 RepID=A0A4Z1P877_9PEZI|nr:NADH-ubiquinone oxidoreductase 30kDa subunit [Venturia nashicola]TLD32561.1 NADH-ubiquinone oxidoreductase 30kDa subunit [Venturia nashicola]